MARPDKVTAVAALTEEFRSSTATVLTEYRGLSVTSMKKLRRDLGSTTKYAVVKNTLTKIAAKEAGFDVPAELLTGPSALAFITEIYKLADLESREVLLAKLAGAMKAILANAIRTVDALRIQREEKEGPLPTVAEVVAEAAVAVEEVAPEVVAPVVTDVVTEEVPAPVEEEKE
ncbi:MAG: 50S ribosomal protein L10 [Actinobacteria bacterium]|nr:50S ribosomal protein L10 [Actinomycetota bacterium]